MANINFAAEYAFGYFCFTNFFGKAYCGLAANV